MSQNLSRLAPPSQGDRPSGETPTLRDSARPKTHRPFLPVLDRPDTHDSAAIAAHKPIAGWDETEHRLLVARHRDTCAFGSSTEQMRIPFTVRAAIRLPSSGTTRSIRRVLESMSRQSNGPGHGPDDGPTSVIADGQARPIGREMSGNRTCTVGQVEPATAAFDRTAGCEERPSDRGIRFPGPAPSAGILIASNPRGWSRDSPPGACRNGPTTSREYSPSPEAHPDARDRTRVNTDAPLVEASRFRSRRPEDSVLSASEEICPSGVSIAALTCPRSPSQVSTGGVQDHHLSHAIVRCNCPARKRASQPASITQWDRQPPKRGHREECILARSDRVHPPGGLRVQSR